MRFVASFSISSRLSSASTGSKSSGFVCPAAALDELLSAAAAALAFSRLSADTVPRHASGLRFSSSVPGGWTGSYSSVASWPARERMIFEPPGCSGRKSVTS